MRHMVEQSEDAAAIVTTEVELCRA